MDKKLEIMTNHQVIVKYDQLDNLYRNYDNKSVAYKSLLYHSCKFRIRKSLHTKVLILFSEDLILKSF